MSLTVAVLDCSGENDDAARNFERELDARTDVFRPPDEELPADSGEFDAAVVSGSWASVYWDLDWIDPLKAWVADAIDDGLPLLGVCFGHQLLADVLGGEVVGREKYELGYHPITHVGDSVLFEGVPGTFVAFTAHSDDVVTLPPGARKLAENQYSIHSFRKDGTFGVQFHAEFDLETATRVAHSREPSEERTPDARETLVRGEDGEADAAKRIFDNFLGYVGDASA